MAVGYTDLTGRHESADSPRNGRGGCGQGRPTLVPQLAVIGIGNKIWFLPSHAGPTHPVESGPWIHVESAGGENVSPQRCRLSGVASAFGLPLHAEHAGSKVQSTDGAIQSGHETVGLPIFGQAVGAFSHVGWQSWVQKLTFFWFGYQQRLSDLIGPYWGTYGIVYRVIQPLLVVLSA